MDCVDRPRRPRALCSREAYLDGEARSGDWLGFQGRGGVSLAIQWYQRRLGLRRWFVNHIEIVIPKRIVGGGRLYSYGSDWPDGVRYTDLRRRILDHDGRVFVRRRRRPWSADTLAGVLREARELEGRPYERDPIELVLSVVDPFDREGDLSSVFCSEAVARLLEVSGDLNIYRGAPSEPEKYSPGELFSWPFSFMSAPRELTT